MQFLDFFQGSSNFRGASSKNDAKDTGAGEKFVFPRRHSQKSTRKAAVRDSRISPGSQTFRAAERSAPTSLDADSVVAKLEALARVRNQWEDQSIIEESGAGKSRQTKRRVKQRYEKAAAGKSSFLFMENDPAASDKSLDDDVNAFEEKVHALETRRSGSVIEIEAYFLGCNSSVRSFFSKKGSFRSIDRVPSRKELWGP